MAGNIAKRPDGKYRARYRDAEGKEHSRHFDRKIDASRWLDQQTTALTSGTWVSPATARMTLSEWCDIWLEGYGTRRASTVRQAKVHIKAIKRDLGGRRIGSLKPSDLKAWTSNLSREYAPSSVYAIYRRLTQILADAVEDGVIPRNPASRKTAPPTAPQRPYVATMLQVWQLHDEFPEHLRPAVLLGAFAGLRVAEAVALETTDIDWLGRTVTPAAQPGGKALKTATSHNAIPVPQDLIDLLSQYVAAYKGSTVVTDPNGRPTSTWAVERAVRTCRKRVEGLPEGFRFHDLRHAYASMLIGAGLDIKTVQARLRHASATTTLNTYGHLLPDRDESSRAAVAAAMQLRHSTGEKGEKASSEV